MSIDLRMWAKGRVRERKRERANVLVCVFCAQCCGEEEEEEAVFLCAIAVVVMPIVAVCFIFPLA
jgi:hypothetical protein